MVRTLTVVNKPSSDTAIEDMLAGTLTVVDRCGTNVATEDTVVSTPSGHIKLVSSEVMTDALQLSGQSTPLRP